VNSRARLAFALDVPDLRTALPLLDRLSGHVDVVKVGLELFAAEGPAAVAAVRERGAEVFLDLKLHDIPETAARAVDAARRTGASLLTVHASGGAAMLRGACAAAEGLRILAVTALTSLDDEALHDLGIAADAASWADRLASLAWNAGVRGFVCSPLEAACLRSNLGPEAFLVTPGIRGPGDAASDQKRTATAAEAVRAGANLLVVGRPIRDAADPAAAADRIRDEIAGA